MSASLAAYMIAADELMESPRVYFWTFTFKLTQPVWFATPAWARLQRDLFDWFGKFQGIRVSEMHREHGLHFHVLMNMRLPVAVVRRLAEPYGFGRIEVQQVRHRKATTRYLVKYLAKGEKLPCRGMRRWVRIGGLGEPVKNFGCQSELAILIRSELAKAKERHNGRLTQRDRFMIMRAVRRSYDAGHYQEPLPGDFVLHTGPEITLRNSTFPKVRKLWKEELAAYPA